MGKHGKLRCFFGFGQSKRTNPKPINSKASLSGLLQKCPAHPNQYFSNGRDQDTLAIEDKSSKMEVTEQTKSLKRKEEGMCDIEMRFSNENMIAGINSSNNHEIQESGVNHSSSADKQPRLGVVGLRASDRGLNAAYSAKLTVHDQEHFYLDNEDPNIQHADDFFPGASREGLPGRSTIPDNPSNSNPAPVHHGDLVNFTKQIDATAHCGNDSSEWNASGACKMSRMKSSGATSSLAADCTCSDCLASGWVKDYDWGWLTNSSKSEKQNNGGRSKSNISHTFTPTCSHEIQLHTYVNDSTPRQTFRLGHSSASFGLNDVFVYSHSSNPSSSRNPDEEVAFTIAERTGRNIQVTFTRKVRHCHCSSDSFSHGSSRYSYGTSRSCQHCNPEETSSNFMVWEPPSRKIDPEKDKLNKYSGNKPIGHQCNHDLESLNSASRNMPPSFSTQVKNKMTDKKSQGLERDQTIQKPKKHSSSAKSASNHRAYVPTKKEERAPHFELSIASYSKLINYFDTNKFLVRRGSAERDVNDNVNSFNSSSYSGRGSDQSSEVSPPRNHRYPQSAALPRARGSPSPTHYSIPNNAVVVDKLCRLAKVLQTVEECSWYWGQMTGQDSRAELRNSPTGTFLLRDSSDPRYLFSLSVKTHQGPTSIRIVYCDGTFRFDSDADDPNAHRQQNSSRSGHNDQRSHPNYVKRLTPVFTCVINMILFYTKHLGVSSAKSRNSRGHSRGHGAESERQGVNTHSESEQGKSNSSSVEPSKEQFMCYWVNRNGRQEIPIMLSKPKPRDFPSLQHICRQSLSASQKLWANERKIDQLPLPNKLKKYLKTYPYPI